MTPYKLADKYYEHHPDGHFFDEETLAFFGEDLSESQVLEETEFVKDWNGHPHECYVYKGFQHNAPIPDWHYAYFDVETFDSILVE